MNCNLREGKRSKEKMLYATLAFVIMILFLLGYGKIKQGNAIPIIGSALTLCIFSGLRDISFGTDLLGYQSRFLCYVSYVDYADIIWQYKQGRIKDGLFYVIMKFFADCGFSYQLFIAIVTGFYIVTVAILIAKHSPIPVISFMMFMSLSWMQFSFTGLRQAVAMGICVIALILLLENKRSILAILCIIAAGYVHSSAWIFLIAPVIARLKFRIGKVLFFQLTVASVALSIFGNALFRVIVAAVAWNKTLANYADSDITLNWTGFLIQLMFSAASYLLYDETTKENEDMPLLYSLMAIGLGFQAFSSVIAEMFRISMYFSIASVCVYPSAVMSINKSKRKPAYYTSIILLIAYFFIGNKYAMYVPIV